MTDHINHNSIKLTRAVNTLFAFTRDAYQSEFGDDASHKREFCRRVAEKYAALAGLKVVNAEEIDHSNEITSDYIDGDGESRCNCGGYVDWENPNRGGRGYYCVKCGKRKFSKSEPTAKPSCKKPTLIPASNPLTTKATALAEQIIELADSPDLPSAGIEYAESVAGKARNILESVESENRATSGQVGALQNMLAGLVRWFNRRGYDDGRGIGDDPMDDYMQFGDFC